MASKTVDNIEQIKDSNEKMATLLTCLLEYAKMEFSLGGQKHSEIEFETKDGSMTSFTSLKQHNSYSLAPKTSKNKYSKKLLPIDESHIDLSLEVHSMKGGSNFKESPSIIKNNPLV